MEVAGLAIGVGGLVATFMACLQCFELVRDIHYFEDAYKSDVLKLEILRLKFARWGESLGLNQEDDHTEVEASLSQKLANPDKDKQLMQDLLNRIEQSFKNASTMSKKIEGTSKETSPAETVIKAAEEKEKKPWQTLCDKMHRLHIGKLSKMGKEVK